MSRDASRIEIKVGALVVFSLVLLVGFIVILGDLSFGSGGRYQVEFDSAAGLKPGADVAISGLKVGQVESLDFITKPQSGPDERAVAVRATITVGREHVDSITRASDFYISTQSVLGESYIEIVTRSLEAPSLESGATVQGVSPPRNDLLLSKASRLLDSLVDVLESPGVSFDVFLSNTASLVKNLDAFLADNRGQFEAILDEGESATGDAASLLAALSYAVGEGKGLKQTLRDARATAANARQISDEAAPAVEDLTATGENARRISQITRRLLEDNQTKIDDSITQVEASTQNLENLSGNADRLVRRIENGEGTVGQLLQDRKMYDDMRELLRIVKRQPWKIMWKE